MTLTPTDPPDGDVGTDPTPPADPGDPSDPPGTAARPGLSTFTIEGRAAPGLFVVGWLATLAGLGLVLIGVLASSALFFYFLGPLVLTIGLVAGCGNQALERRARGAAYAGPSPYLVFATLVAAVYAAGYAVGFVLVRIPGSAGLPDAVVQLLTISLQAAVFFGVLRLLVVGTDALSWSDMGWRRLDRIQAGHFLRGAAIALPVIGVTTILAGLLVRLLNAAPESPLPPTGTTEGLLLQLIAGALIAPLSEEAVFRGFAVTAWARSFGEDGAIVRASLVFALAHVITISGQSVGEVGGLILVGFVSRIPVAIALGWLFVRTRSIWAPLGLHVTFNAVLLIAAELVYRTAAAG